jgi:hypothetical protein
LIRHKLALLRDVGTSSRDFKLLVGEIASLMTYEVTRDLKTEPIEVVTPLETMIGERVAPKVALVPILRAGLGMVEGIVQLIPNARVGHIGLYRDHETLRPVSYYFKVPTPVADHRFFVLDAGHGRFRGGGGRRTETRRSNRRGLTLSGGGPRRRGDLHGSTPRCADLCCGVGPRLERQRVHSPRVG